MYVEIRTGRDATPVKLVVYRQSIYRYRLMAYEILRFSCTKVQSVILPCIFAVIKKNKLKINYLINFLNVPLLLLLCKPPRARTVFF